MMKMNKLEKLIGFGLYRNTIVEPTPPMSGDEF